MSSRSEWQTRGDYIAFPGGSCVATLVYTVRLIQPGALHYTYQYPDDDTIFEFQVLHFILRAFCYVHLLITFLNG